MKTKCIYSCLAALLLSICAASAYDFFGGFIPQGTPVINGIIAAGEWSAARHINMAKFYGEDARIDIYLMWDETHLYIAADIQDFELWVDDYNPAYPWVSTWDDDAFKLEIDPYRDRAPLLNSQHRVFAVNANGSAMRFDQGNGSGGTVGASQLQAINYQVVYDGTLNNHTFSSITDVSERDQGYVVEAAIPWANIFGTASYQPYLEDGRVIGMNFTVIEDDTGGPLDAVYYREWKRVFDEITSFMGEESRPENWAAFVLSVNNDLRPPAAPAALQETRTGAFSTTFSFVAPGGIGTNGWATQYDIRTLKGSLTDLNWDDATVYTHRVVPQKAGTLQTIQVIGLDPDSAYDIGIKALDEKGNESPLATLSIQTALTDSPEDKGFITVDPGQRYFAWEDGEPFIVIGDNHGIAWPAVRSLYDGPIWDDTFGAFRNYYVEEGPGQSIAYLEMLRDHGVNTIRLMAESYDLAHPVYLFTNASAGPANLQFNEPTLQFLERLVDACASNNIAVVITPFDTYYYAYASRWSEVPFSQAMGGPMETADDFFDPAYRDYLKAVWQKLIDRLGDRKNILAWQLINEFDSDDIHAGWNRALFSVREETLNDLAAFVRGIDSDHMLCASSVRWDPRFSTNLPQQPDRPIVGADVALVLNNPGFDFNVTHTYFPDIRDPNHNVPGNRTTPYFTYEAGATDLDNTLSPAIKIAQAVRHYHSRTFQPRPYFDTEHGPMSIFINDYDTFFSEAQDNQYFHNMIWAHLAGGDAGTGLRWPGEMLSEHKLTPQMRQYQLASHNFLQENLDFRGFHPRIITTGLTTTGTNGPVYPIGISDGRQGILFIVNDERRQVNGWQTDLQITIPQLDESSLFHFEFWNSYDHTATNPFVSLVVTSSVSGAVTVEVPAFERTQTIKFYKGQLPPAWDDGYEDLGGNWRRLVWFGDYVPTGGGWFWHNIHSYFFPTSTSTSNSIYLYTMDMGWLFTRSNRYPYLYRFRDQSWLWYMPGSANPRWFNNLTLGEWESTP